MNQSDGNIRLTNKDANKRLSEALHEAEWNEARARLNAIGYERECKGVPYDNPFVQIEMTLFEIESKTEMLKKLINQYLIK
tara:strand:+ start:535 stop:777 length:243 start_codon:yes stop_codon:yes gene_type:complete